MNSLNNILSRIDYLVRQTPINYDELADNTIAAFDKINELISEGQAQSGERWIKELKEKLTELLEEFYGTGNGI